MLSLAIYTTLKLSCSLKTLQAHACMKASGALQHQAERGQPIPSTTLQDRGRSLKRRRQGGVLWGSGSARGGVWVRGDSVSIVPAPDSPLSRGSRFPRSAQQTNAPQPFFPSLCSDVINYHQNARDGERECESARECICVWGRERASEAAIKKGTIVCAEIKKSPLNHYKWLRLENAPKCRVWWVIVGLSHLVRSPQIVMFKCKQPWPLRDTPVLYYILSSVTLACIWTSKRGREWSFSTLAKILCVCVYVSLHSYNWWTELSIQLG